MAVVSVIAHETADIAVLKVDAPTERLTPFHTLALNYAPGLAVCAWGYPEEPLDSGGMTPTARTFRGNLQRLFHHTMRRGYE